MVFLFFFSVFLFLFDVNVSFCFVFPAWKSIPHCFYFLKDISMPCSLLKQGAEIFEILWRVNHAVPPASREENAQREGINPAGTAVS